ncbi:MAG: ABC transporter substrate-binding protein [Acidimicrobiales bacterium]
MSMFGMRGGRSTRAAAASVAVLALVAAACGSTSPGSTSSTSAAAGTGSTAASSSSASSSPSSTSSNGAPSGTTLDIANFLPFSGADAAFGPLGLSGCYPAVSLINAAGGAMGHHFKCTSMDSRGDPVDAVPAMNKMLANSKNIAVVFGPSSDTVLSTASLLEQGKMPFFTMSGNVHFLDNTSPYFWRLTPPDNYEGYAMAVWAHKKGYTRAAAVFATGTTAQSNGPASIKGFKNLGGKIVANLKLTPGQGSYRTEVSQLLAAKPQVIFYTAPASTSATFFAEMKQLGTIPPVIVTEVAEEPKWTSAVGGSIGRSTLHSQFTAMEASTDTNTPGYPTFKKALLSSNPHVPNVAKYVSDPFTITYYDAANLTALAMIASKSSDRTVYNPWILKLTKPSPGAVIVHDFAVGKKALKQGKTIQYVGAEGKIVINSHHNASGAFKAVTMSTNPKKIGEATKQELAAAAK